MNAGTKSPFMSAIECSNVDLVRLFLENGADCNDPKKCSNDLEESSKDKNSRCEAPDLTHYPTLVAARPRDMENCLERMNNEKAGSWSAEIVTLLLQHGAKVDLPLSPSQTLLHYVFQHAPATTL